MIIDIYLKAWNSQESIAELMNTPRKTIADIIKNSENRQMSIFGKDFKPLIYSIWNQAKQDNDRADHFGSFPEYFIQSATIIDTHAPVEQTGKLQMYGIRTFDLTPRTRGADCRLGNLFPNLHFNPTPRGADAYI